jgi:hypothetical protein
MRDWLLRPVGPVASQVAIVVLAVATWALVIVPLWRFSRSRVSLNKLRKIVITVSTAVTRLVSQKKARVLAIVATLVLFFAFGFWTALHKDALTAKTKDSTALAPAQEKQEPSPSLTPAQEKQELSPYATRADFAKYAMKLREQELLKVEPQLLIPTSSRPAVQRYPWKMNIVTTLFWVGEETGRNKPVHNYKSAWDFNWTANYGGTDNPEPSARRNYIPIAFVPRQNPFYFALPYNDVTHGQFRPEAPLVIPWFKQSYTGPGQSVCRHRWIAIRKGNRVCYAQWEDCGPFRTNHFQYVFGSERPKPNTNHGAGLNVSPAVRDYLGLAPTDVTDWQFVEVRDVAPGPWRSYGDNNHFVIARRQSEQRVPVP